MPYHSNEEYDALLRKTQAQETQVNETTQELPAVSKLREAFEVARNAIVDGSELAKQVEELRLSVSNLRFNVDTLTNDLQYVRSRNKELDEQVTEVRRQRDNAISEGLGHKERADRAEGELTGKQRTIDDYRQQVEALQSTLASSYRQRDDAMNMALEYEEELKTAEDKLAVIENVFGKSPLVEANPKPVPHYDVQPRDEVGKFQPFEEAKTLDHGTQGSY